MRLVLLQERDLERPQHAADLAGIPWEMLCSTLDSMPYPSKTNDP
jgi:hypothetical protein